MPFKLTKFIFLPAVLVCMGLRIYLKLTSIDPSTGFYETTNQFPVQAFTWVIGIALAFILLTGLLGERKSTGIYMRYTAPVWPLAMLCGVATLPLAVFSSLEQFTYMAEADFSGSLLSAGLLVLLRIVLLSAAPLASAILFFVIGMRLRNNSREEQMNGLVLLLPLFWLLADLMFSYMDYTAMRYLSDQKLEIVTLILLVLTLLGWGRTLGGIATDKGVQQFTAFGLGYALVALPLATGVLAAAAVGLQVEDAMSIWKAIFHLCFGLYVAVLALRTAK